MAQFFCSFVAVPDPYQVVAGPAGSVGVLVAALVSLTWQDATTGKINAGTQALSAYGGTTADYHADNYYLLAVKGNPVPVLLKEKDIDNADTILTGAPQWAKMGRLENGILYPTPQP